MRGLCCGSYLRPGDLPIQGDTESPLRSLYRQVIDTAHSMRRSAVDRHWPFTHEWRAMSALSERRIVIGGEEAVSADIFPASVAYVALGHLHKPH